MLRRSSTPRAGLIALISLPVMGLLVGALWLGRPDLTGGDRERPLKLFCAAGLKAPVEQILATYSALDAQATEQVRVTYGGSGTLLAGLAIAKDGDLFLPADQRYLDEAKQRGLVQEIIPIGSQTPVIAVRMDHGERFEQLADLLRPGLRFGLCNPEAAAIGRATQRAAQAHGLWESLAQAATVQKPSVTDLAADVVLGTLDAAILWDTTVTQFEGLVAFHTAELDAHPSEVAVGVLLASKSPTRSLRVARYLSATDSGQTQFARAGFGTAGGDAFTPRPQLDLWIDVALAPAVEPTLDRFKVREGLELRTRYVECAALIDGIRSGIGADGLLCCSTPCLRAAELQPELEVLSAAQGPPLVCNRTTSHRRIVERLADALTRKDAQLRISSLDLDCAEAGAKQ